MLQELSLSVVGVLYPNADGSNRLFEIKMLNPGDRIALVLEPDNKSDPSAIAIYSFRGYQIGYLAAERCGWIGAIIRQGLDVRAVFQQQDGEAAVIRLRFDGKEPTLPMVEPTAPPHDDPEPDNLARDDSDPASGFWPDFIPPDE